MSGVLLLAMFAAYRVLMAGDNRHAYNRGVLLSIYMIAFLSMPLYNLPGNLFAATPAAAPAFHLADVAVTVDVARLQIRGGDARCCGFSSRVWL